MGEFIAGLRIVPVSISYELDPCDAMKARELSQRSVTGAYEKQDREDVTSIGLGISGNKGRVHLHFGEPLGAELDSPDAVAAAIDAQVISGYRLHETNLWAYRRLHGEPALGSLEIVKGSCTEAEFDARVDAVAESERPFSAGQLRQCAGQCAGAGRRVVSALTAADKDAIREAYNAMIAARGLTARWGQRQMIAEVANALARIALPASDAEAGEGGAPIAVIEAGTGTGKTIAYVIPAIIMARSLGKRLVIATATVALQEQLMHKDLPDIRAGSGLDFDYVLAKGRRRYLCLSQLDRLMAQESAAGQTLGLYPDELGTALARDTLESYGAMLDALGRGDWDGDRDNWAFPIEDAEWLPLTADQGQCTGRRCPNIGNCSFYRARDGSAGGRYRGHQPRPGAV
jgi:hypothetical protein